MLVPACSAGAKSKAKGKGKGEPTDPVLPPWPEAPPADLTPYASSVTEGEGRCCSPLRIRHRQGAAGDQPSFC